MATKEGAFGHVATREQLEPYAFCEGIQLKMPEDVGEPKGGKSSAEGSKSKRDGNRRKRNKGRS